jgi:antitoxin component of MazEF toxin-antitoxin module
LIEHSSSSFTEQHFSKNQNAIGPHLSQNKDISFSDPKENQQLPDTSSPSINFTTDNQVELRINTNKKSESKNITITRRSSKPSRHESVQKTTSETRHHQRDRYRNYRNRLGESQLYSLSVSSNGLECYGTNCQPSVYHASHQCRSISPLMNDQDIKQNISYISLTNLSNIIDHEPNVSRRDSYSRSTSNILMHKTSLFLVDIFSKYL